MSLTLSATESKKAPRGDAVPDALATAPSSRSGTAESAQQDHSQEKSTGTDGHSRRNGDHQAGRGELVGLDTGASQARAYRLQAPLDARAQSFVEHLS